MSQVIMNAGDLRNVAQIQTQTNTQDTFGQAQQTWQTVLTAMVGIRIAGQRELYQADQLTGAVTHIISMRWLGALVRLEPGMRVLINGHAYRIQNVENVELANRAVRLYVQELNGGAE